jgi:hypothetical protein
MHLIEPCEVANAFAKHFQFVYNNYYIRVFRTLSLSSEIYL